MIVPEVRTVTTQSGYTNEEKVKCHVLVNFFIQGSKKSHPVVLKADFLAGRVTFEAHLPYE